MSMNPQAVKRTPEELAAQRRRRVVAQESARQTLASIKASPDPEQAMEACRATIRSLAAYAAQLTDPARAIGILSGAAADVCPSYRPAKRFSAAEALFSKPEESDDEA